MHFTHSSEREALIIMMNTSSIVDATTNTNSISCLEAEGLYNNTYLYSDHDKDLQKKFWDVFNDNIKKYNLSYLDGNINATFDINFLRKNKKWLN